VLLSGHLDGELLQSEDQRVRIHLEECPQCRTTLEEMASLREVTMTTRFAEPKDEQWREAPRGAPSRVLRRFGWLLAVVWALLVSGFAAWELITGPERLFEKLLVFGGLTAFAMLFVSVLLDRIHDSKTDRYRRVEK
jgi:predicted anti-sigma-YlaC factor YlaD